MVAVNNPLLMGGSQGSGQLDPEAEDGFQVAREVGGLRQRALSQRHDVERRPLVPVLRDTEVDDFDDAAVLLAELAGYLDLAEQPLVHGRSRPLPPPQDLHRTMRSCGIAQVPHAKNLSRPPPSDAFHPLPTSGWLLKASFLGRLRAIVKEPPFEDCRHDPLGVHV